MEQVYGKLGTEYANWAATMANELGAGVPWIMCSQNNIAIVIDTCNGFYCNQWIQSHQQQFPNQPSLCVWQGRSLASPAPYSHRASFTENWTGWFQDWTMAKPTRPAQYGSTRAARLTLLLRKGPRLLCGALHCVRRHAQQLLHVARGHQLGALVWRSLHCAVV